MFKKLFFVVALIISCHGLTAQQHLHTDTSSIAYKLAEAQLIGYNTKNIESFLAPYSDSVMIYQYPNKLLSKGKNSMRVTYTEMFEKTPDLFCTIIKRMVLGNTVIDEESVIFKKGMPPFKAIAIYTIEKDKIQTVTFIQ